MDSGVRCMLACWSCKGSSPSHAHVRYYPGMHKAGIIQAVAVTCLEWGRFYAHQAVIHLALLPMSQAGACL